MCVFLICLFMCVVSCGFCEYGDSVFVLLLIGVDMDFIVF